MKSFSRGKVDSSVAAAAYRAGFELVDTSTGQQSGHWALKFRSPKPSM
jgi:hypothetical protein